MYVFDNYYSLSELCKTAYSLVMTKLFYSPAFLIRRPFYMRGRPRVKIGRGFRTGYRCRIETFGDKRDRTKKLFIGDNTHIGDEVHIAAAERVEIGKDCLFASHIFVSDCSHGSYDNELTCVGGHPANRPLVSKPTIIGDGVWLGENVCVLMGSHIGSGCIVGANTVVNKSFPENCILAGAPAKIVKRFDASQRKWIKFDVK